MCIVNMAIFNNKFPSFDVCVCVCARTNMQTIMTYIKQKQLKCTAIEKKSVPTRSPFFPKNNCCPCLSKQNLKKIYLNEF